MPGKIASTSTHTYFLQSHLADTHMLQINSPSVLTVFKTRFENNNNNNLKRLELKSISAI